MYYLSIYINQFHYGVYLPEGDTWQTKVTIPAEYTGWDRNIILAARSLEGRGYLLPESGFCWESGTNDEIEILPGKTICMEPTALLGRVLERQGKKKEDLRIRILPEKCSRSYTVMTKYYLPQEQTVSIGSKDGADIVLRSGGGMTELRNYAGKCVLFVSQGQQVYLNGSLISNESTMLSMGDMIVLDGIVRIYYMGDRIAVNKAAVNKINLEAVQPLELKSGVPDISIKSSGRLYNRKPRIIHPMEDEKIIIEGPVAKQGGNNMPILLTLGPSMTMVIPMLLSSFVTGRDPRSILIMTGGSAMLSVFWGLISMRYRKKGVEEYEVKRRQVYEDYIAETEIKLESLVQKERERLNENNLSIASCITLPSAKNNRLWERTGQHDDFSAVRLGIGEILLPSEISISENKLEMVEDDLKKEPRRLKEAYEKIQNAPIILNMKRRSLIGVLARSSEPKLLQSMVIQQAAMHSYHDLRIAILTDEHYTAQWAWARWLPHVFLNEERNMRMVVSSEENIQDVLNALENIWAMRNELVGASENKKDAENSHAQSGELPRFVVFCTDPKLIENHIFMRHVIDHPLGFTLVLQGRNVVELPKECDTIIEADKPHGAMYNSQGEVKDIQFEFPDQADLLRFSKSIAPIKVKDTVENSAIPTLVNFLDVYGVRNTRDLDVWRFWNENHAYEGIKAIVGIGSGSRPFVLDISDKSQGHGPHGLAAGTTGSGKSVMLQTYILSLALNYHPEQVQFILIDYKGGGMANAMSRLPHIAGIIDNLQGERAIQRALQSIKGEIKRREEAFKRLGIDHIDDYIRFFNNDPKEKPLGHIVIVVDEFAELKREQPDFMRELVSAARVGRSVGLHLILATQKPSNSVDDEIWSNTRFRICLRVASRGDSNDMLKRPDAAYLRGMGRCYVQVGNDEIFEQVQASYSGADYAPGTLSSEEIPKVLNGSGQPIRVKKKHKQGKSLVKILLTEKANNGGPSALISRRKKRRIRGIHPPRRAGFTYWDRCETQMDAVIRRIEQVCREHHLKRTKRLWLDEMGRILYLNQVPGVSEFAFTAETGWKHVPLSPITVPYGMLDDTPGQRYIPISINLTEAHNYMVVGPASTGKTTFLQTLVLSLALRYSPDQVNFYIFSLTGNVLNVLNELPHTIDLVVRDKEDEIIRLLDHIAEEDARRRLLFEELTTDSFEQYNEIAAISGKETLPAIIVFVDRLAQMLEVIPENQLTLLGRLLQESSSRGIYFVITAMSLHRDELPYKLAPSFKGIALRLGEKDLYKEVLRVDGHISAEETQIMPTAGRGLAIGPGSLCETQTAIFASTDNRERTLAIRKLAEQMKEAWNGEIRGGIARIPENFSLKHLLEMENGDYRDCPVGRFPFMLDKLSASIVEVDFTQKASWLITGEKGSGITATLLSVCEILRAQGAEIVLFGNAPEIQRYAEENGLEIYDARSRETDRYFNEISKPETDRRVAAYLAANGDDTKIEAYHNQYRTIVLAIDDVRGFLENQLIPVCEFVGELVRVGDKIMTIVLLGADLFIINGNDNKRPIQDILRMKRGLVMGGFRGISCPWTGVRADLRCTLPNGEGLLLEDDGFKTVIVPRR